MVPMYRLIDTFISIFEFLPAEINKVVSFSVGYDVKLCPNLRKLSSTNYGVN